MSNNKELLKIEFIKLKDYNFEIPIYQRPYAWKAEEVETLLNDIWENNDESYFLGTLVVDSKEKETYEVIDGQQRLTTLYLISVVFGCNNAINIDYQIREEDKKFLEALKNKNVFKENSINLSEINIKNVSYNLIDNINAILKWKNEKKKENENNNSFNSKLKKVYFVLSVIPQNTDVAKFFEVMNSRGKQLEHHEILKARFLNILKDDNEYDYAKIWDFCSDMNYYLEDLIYYSLLSEHRKEDKIPVIRIRKNLLDSIKEVIRIRKNLLDSIKEEENIKNYFNSQNSSNNKSSENSKKLIGILKNNEDNQQEQNKAKEYSKPDNKEVNSIINFPTFLLHTLRLFIIKENKKKNLKNLKYDMKNFSLDDKKLLEVFGNGDKNKLFFKGNSEIAKKFILFLLKMRILFDYFIFKRSVKSTTGEEDIKLRKIKIKNDKYELGELDRELINLQLLFSFTSPNYLQQEWLTPTLGYLYENLKNGFNEDIYNELKTFLENLDRNLAIERLKDNPDLKKVFDKTLEEPNHQNTLSNSKEKDNKQIKNELNENLNENLNRGTATEHYWFYKLEYLLWKNSKDKFNQIKPPFKNFDYSNIKEKYRLTRKNSIEHIHPQSKTNENEWTQNNNENNCEKKCHIDCFGNLALISSHLNSKLIDKSFENKKVYIQEQLNNGTIESLKMLLVYSKYEKWTHVECEEHHNEMIELLLNSLSAQKNNA